MHVGVVGLGAGTLAAYATQPNQRISFYEINPEVVTIARTTYFTFSERIAAERSRTCDPRRRAAVSSRASRAAEHFDVLVLDAFSGDAAAGASALTQGEAFGL